MATFEELTGMSIEETAEVRPLDTIHQTGEDTRREEGEALAAREEETDIGGMFGAAWERNITNMMYDTVQRKWSNAPEKSFDPSLWVTENKDTLPGQNLEEFNSVRSTAEAEELREDMLRAADNDLTITSKGYSGIAAAVLSGIVDPAEIAIGIATAGTAKGITLASRFQRAAQAGFTGGITSAAAAFTVDPLADTKQIVYGGLTGALMSTTMSVAATGFNKSVTAVRNNYASEVDDLADPSIQATEAPSYTMQDNPQSLGAGSLNTAGQIDPDGFNPVSRSIYEQSMQTIRDHNIGQRMEDTDFTADTPEARAAKRFSDALANSPYEVVKTDFDRLMYGGSRVETALAYNLFESPEGRIRNNRSGAILKETYEQRLSSHSLPVMDDSFTSWAKQRDIGILDKQKPAVREAFDRELFEELEARFHEGAPISADPAIRKAADAVDAGMDDALRLAKGRDGELSVSGFEDIQPKAGYVPHRWSGKAIRRAEAKGYTRKQLEDLLTQGYAKTHPDMPIEYRSMISKAVLRRAMAKEDGVDTNMLNTLDSDAQDYLRQTLKDSGVPDNTIDNLLDSIRGRKEEQSIIGSAKERTQIDLRTKANGLSLLDLVDTNMTRVVSRYNRELSGQAALARKGIQNRAQRKDMIEAALAERRSRGLPADEKQRRFLEDMFTYFDSGPIGGGIGDNVARAKRITNLALLNQMGMTQAGETGAQIAAVGLDTWKKHAKQVYTEMRTQGPDGPIAAELRPWMGDIGNEHMLFRDDLMMDELAASRDLNTFLGKLDFGLGKGQRLQGYVSGFYQVRSFQQRVAVTSMADKVMQRLRDGVDLEVMDSLGLSRNLKKYIDDGTVSFDEAGFVDKLNMAMWDSVDAEDFALALNRHTHQVVQKALAGEESMWMHKSVGSIYMHLKSFPMLAMRKQAARLAGVQRPQAVVSVLMGLATAGLAYEARQVINGKPENVNPMEALKGAVGMSNMTGWIPMLADPAAAVLGLNDWRFNQYGRHDLNTGIVAVPPVIPTLNRMAQIPGAANPWGDLTQNERIRIMQSTPLIGNMYGFSAMFNSMKE